MMPISTQTLLAWVDAVGWSLLHFLWQGALVGLAYRVLRPLCHSVTAKYRLGMLMLVAMLLCPLATFVYLWPTTAIVAAAPAIALPSVGIAALDVAAEAATVNAGASGLEAWLPWLVAVWFLGASAIAIRAFAQWRRLSWLVRNATIPLADCATVLARLRARFGIHRQVRLLGSLGIDTPMLVGWLRPVILLPISMLSGFTPQQIELIIAHELGHVRRWDYLANLLQVVIETILFYHPMVHWISREVRDARESCCDDLVLALADGSPVVYASALADLEELRQDTGVAAPALAASGGVLLTRIRRIVGVPAMHDTLPRTGGWPVVLVLAASLLAVLRLHGLPSLATTLLRVPVASTAAITGNTALLNSAPAAAPATIVPAPVATAPARDEAPVSETVVVQLPQRPHIGVTPVAFAPPRVTNIRQPLAALPSLPEPAAPPAVPEPGMVAPVEVPAAAARIAKAAAVATPVALQRVQPDYPVREKIRGVTGKVDLEFGIAADGSVTDVRVLESSPEHVFDHTAIAALKQWRFATPVDPGQRYTQTFAFTHGGAPATEQCREVIGSHICRHMAAGEDAER